MNSTWTRVAGTLLGVAVLLHSVDMGKAVSSLAGADVRWMIFAVFLTALATLSSVFEWGVLLRVSAQHAGDGHRHLFTWPRLTSSYVQSLFFSQLLPAGVGGDAMRTVEMGKVVGHGRILASLAGSRMAGTLGMAAWGLAAAVLLRNWLGVGSLIAAAAFTAVMLLAWTGALSADRIVSRGVIARSGRAFVRTLHTFGSTFAGYRRHPHAVLQCILVGAAGWGINILALSIFGRALGMNVSWTIFAVVIPLSLLATLAPFSVNGLGLREGMLVGMLTHAGVTATQAAAMSLIVDLQMLPFGIIGAALWMRHRRRANPVAEAGEDVAEVAESLVA